MEAWVIKSKKQNKFISRYGIFDGLQNVVLFKNKSMAKYEIDCRNYLDCKPVKVRIDEVEE